MMKWEEKIWEKVFLYNNKAYCCKGNQRNETVAGKERREIRTSCPEKRLYEKVKN